MKKILSFIIVISMLFALSSCGKEEESVVQTVNRDVYVTLDISGISTLDVYKVNNDIVNGISRAVLETLITYDPDSGEFQPVLLSELPSITEDGLIYSFTIKRGVSWSDGSELTASDVQFTLERMFSPSEPGINAPYYLGINGAEEFMNGESEHISGFSIVNNRNFTITLDEANSSFMSLLASPMLQILPQTAWEAAGADWGNKSLLTGSGPFTVGSFTPGEKVILIPNDNYRGDKPDLEHLIIYNGTSASAAADYAEGKTDFFILSYDQIDHSRELYKDKLHEQSVDTVAKISMNVLNEPMNDIYVRKAILYAIDQEQLIDSYFKDKADMVKTLIPKGIPGHDENDAGWTKNTDYSKQLLSDAGYTDGISVKASVSDADTDSAFLLQLISDQLSESGITLEIIKYEDDVYKEKRQSGQLEMTISKVSASYPDPYPFITGQFHSSVSDSRSICLKDEGFDEQASVLKNSSYSDIPELSKAMDDYLCRELACAYPLYQLKKYYLLSDDRIGIFINPDGIIDYSGARYIEKQTPTAK